MSTFILDPAKIRDISPEALDEHGRLRVLPTSWWATTTPEERALFGHRYGLYSFPTVELVEHLRSVIDGRSAIEIGAGHGVLAESLDIPATDNKMQEKEPYRSIYTATNQPIVPYGPNVIDCPANVAVRKYRPEVVIGCWVTHKYDPRRHAAGGNEVGVDEEDILAHCGAYVFIGNDSAHKGKKIWRNRHQIEHLPFIVSRSMKPGTDYIAVWAGSGRRS